MSVTLPKLFVTSAKKGLVAFTEDVTKDSTRAFMRKLKALHKGQTLDTVYLRTGGETKGQIRFFSRLREGFRFFWKKFTELTEASLSPGLRNKLEFPLLRRIAEKQQLEACCGIKHGAFTLRRIAEKQQLEAAVNERTQKALAVLTKDLAERMNLPEDSEPVQEAAKQIRDAFLQGFKSD